MLRMNKSHLKAGNKFVNTWSQDYFPDFEALGYAAFAYFNRAGIYFEIDEYENAIDDYKLYLVFDPDDEDAQYNPESARILPNSYRS